MSILTDLESALEAKLETEAEHPSTATSWHMDVAKADETLHALLTEDTIAALVAVAEVAGALVTAVGVVCDDAPTIDVCLDGYHRCNSFDRKRCELSSALSAALAPLVKEADDAH